MVASRIYAPTPSFCAAVFALPLRAFPTGCNLRTMRHGEVGKPCDLVKAGRPADGQSIRRQLEGRHHLRRRR